MGVIKRSRRDTEVHFEGDRPTILVRGKQRYRVKEVVEQWDVRGTWWGNERHRRYVTLRTDRGTFEVARDMKTGSWSISGIYD
jgi:hypothetical protein